MIKIGYPTDSLKVQEMNDTYFNLLQDFLGDIASMDAILSAVKLTDGSDLTCKKLLTAPFNELLHLDAEIKLLSDDDKEVLRPLCNYTDGQTLVAKYFMEQKELKLSSCFYCNIDSIYTFSKMATYWGPLDFIQRADFKQLQLIKGIAVEKANIIIAKRESKQFEKIEDFPVSATILERVKLLEYNPTHNHFTLDHFHHKAEYIFLKLCLYNFVPSCYVCNSKYKNAFKLYVTKPELSSPSSTAYTFDKDVQFKVYYAAPGGENPAMHDFAVDLEVSDNHASHNLYLDVLRIRGRYVHHKNVAKRLIKLKVDYPAERINELAQALNMSVELVKRMVFGTELFDEEFNDSSLIKYKRDVAKSIKLLE